MKGRDIILYLALKYKGSWNDIYTAIKNKEMIDEDEVNNINISARYVTIVDPDYPELFKKIHKPPFVIFYKGNLMYLSATLIGVFGAHKHLTNEHKKLLERRTYASMGELDTHVKVYPGPIVSAPNDAHLVISEYYNEAIKDAQIWTSRLLVGVSNMMLATDLTRKNIYDIIVGYAMYHNKTIGILSNYYGSIEPNIFVPIKTNDDFNPYLYTTNDSISDEYLPEGFA
jgi:hypothetical protein